MNTINANPLAKYTDNELNAYMIYLLLKDYGKDKLIEIINKIDMDKVINNE